MSRNIAIAFVPACTLACASFEAEVAQAETSNPNDYQWSEEHRGEPLDLTGFRLTFADEFDSFQISGPTGNALWKAPVHSDVGSSLWDIPSPQSDIYTVKDGILRIRARKTPDGRWHAGNIQTVDAAGNGFSQQYGYFEARIQFPAMPGAWCAFWLKSQPEHIDKSLVRPEIDVVEWYGGDPKGHHQTVHLWPPDGKYITPGRLAKHWYRSNYTGMPEIGTGWHTHGVLITPQWVIMYVDRKEVSRFKTFDEYKLPLYPLVSLTLYEKDVAKAVSPFDMQVDYVRIYDRKIPNPPEMKKP